MIELAYNNISILKEECNKGCGYLLWNGIKGHKDDKWIMIIKSIGNITISGSVYNIVDKFRNNKEWEANINYFLREKEYNIFVLNKDEFAPYCKMLIVDSLEKTK